MKTIKISLIALIASLATMQPILHAMQNSQKPPTLTQTHPSVDYEKKQRELFKGARQLMESHDRQKASREQKKLDYLRNLSNTLNRPDINQMRDQIIDKFEDKARTKRRKINHTIFNNSPKVNQNDQDKRTSYNDEKPIVREPVENETTILIPTVQIEKRSELLENSEIATIQTLPDLIKNKLNDSTHEAKDPAELTDSQWEPFPSSNNLTNQATNNANNNATDKLNERIVKIATLINYKFNQDKQKPILLAKQLTQEEIIQMTRQKIDQFAGVIDTTYVEIFDKFITSTQKLPEPRTSGAMEFYYNQFFVTNQQQDPFAIEQFGDKCERTVQSLFIEIKNDLHKIADQNKRNELINYFKQNKNKWCMNSYFTEKTLNALMHDSKHETSQQLGNITIKNGDTKNQVTPQLYDKITALTDKCTNNMQIFGKTIFDKSNLPFEQKYRIEKAKAEKYNLPQLVKTANKISSTIGTWMITQLY